jgi:hypothetical protein
MSCPVPEEQRPLNQYRELQESLFFRWATLPSFAYWQTNLKVWLSFWLLTAPIVSVSFSPSRHPAEFLFWTSGSALFCFLLPLLHLYLGWRYVGDRLVQTKVFYEETGWYDGQTWQKPATDLLREKLLFEYQVRPYLQRLRHTLWLTLGIIGLYVLTWQIRGILSK